MMRAMAELGTGSREWGLDQAAAAREAIARDLCVTPEHDEADGVPPQTVLDALRAVTPRNTIFSCDVGAHKSLSCQAWKSYAPRTFMVSNGLSPMGFGLASALGAKLARPDRPVVSVVGDGGLLMYAGELATATRNGLKLTVLLMSDGALSSIKVKQVRADYPSMGVEFPRPGWGEIARGYGFSYAKVGQRSECADALSAALAGPEPTLIEAYVDPEEYNTTQ
jgi:acetolactate synthase-1/2/3 large subunit